MDKKKVQLKTIASALATNAQIQLELDPVEISTVFLEAIDTLAFRYQKKHNPIQYDFFADKVIKEMDRIRGIIARCQPF